MIWAIVLGFAIGSIPSADLVGRIAGIDLRGSGSRNPGAANALRLGGKGPAVVVLALDLIKGASAAIVGGSLGGDSTALAAAVAAVAGQIHNPWFGFEGGKGLGVTAGSALILFPLGLAVAIVPVVVGTLWLGTAVGGAAGLVALLGAAMAWGARDLPALWGAATDDRLVWYAIGIAALALPKFLAGIRHRVAA